MTLIEMMCRAAIEDVCQMSKDMLADEVPGALSFLTNADTMRAQALDMLANDIIEEFDLSGEAAQYMVDKCEVEMIKLCAEKAASNMKQIADMFA